MLKRRYQEARTLAEATAAAEKNRELWIAMGRRARAPEEYVARVEAAGGRWHLLVLSEDWCGDAVNTVPVVAALAEAASNLDLRILERDRNLDLMDAHLSNGARAIPVVMVLDQEYRERGWWGSRPRALQEWVMTVGKQMPPEECYREIRRWYARDQGRTTLEEIVTLIEAAARERGTAVA